VESWELGGKDKKTVNRNQQPEANGRVVSENAVIASPKGAANSKEKQGQ